MTTDAHRDLSQLPMIPNLFSDLRIDMPVKTEQKAYRMTSETAGNP